MYNFCIKTTEEEHDKSHFLVLIRQVILKFIILTINLMLTKLPFYLILELNMYFFIFFKIF